MTDDTADDYVIPEGGGVPWRNLRMDERNRPPERDVEVTAVRTMALQGNFPWGIVKVETDREEYGIGEVFIGEEALDIVDRCAHLVVGENPLDVDRIVEHLEQERTAPGNMGQAAFSGIEIALLDLKGKVLDVPVYELLGGKYRDEVTIYCDTHAGESLGQAQKRDPTEVYTPESYARAAREVVDEGFDALKFDLDVPTHRDVDTAARRMDNEAIEHKVSLVAAAREAVGPGVDLAVDLHWNFTVETATRLAAKLEPYDLAWIEDPVPPKRVEAHRRVTESTRTPILTGENVVTVDGFNDLLTEDAMDVAAPDVNRCGGLLQLRRIAVICDMYGVPLAPHNISSPVGTVAGVHACAAMPNVLAMEYHARDVPWWEDLVVRTGESGPVIEDGSVALPEGPGLGIEIDADVAAEHLVDGSDLIV
jgi:L-alanine-DL-glutamate epimerase-like enolase superfamily enzyme